MSKLTSEEIKSASWRYQFLKDLNWLEIMKPKLLKTVNKYDIDEQNAWKENKPYSAAAASEGRRAILSIITWLENSIKELQEPNQ